MNNELRTSIENPTLAHFRHFSSLFTNLSSTTVEKPLQISSFLQNKANFPDDQMNVNKVITRDYENIANWKVRKNKANSKPNKANLLKAKMNVNKVLTKDYENKPPIRAPKKQSQISKQQKPMQTSLPQRIMKKTALSASDKTKPNKPNSNTNQSQFQRQKILLLMAEEIAAEKFSKKSKKMVNGIDRYLV